MEIFTRIVLALFWLLLARSSFMHWQDTGSWIGFGLLAVNTTMVVLFLSRRQSKDTSRDPIAWTLGAIGTLTPLFLRPTAAPPWIFAGEILQIAGVVAIALCLFGLGRSFGIVPANRGIKSQGVYQWVRHPLYASEIFFFAGYTLTNPSTWNIGCMGVLVLTQFLRALKEEKLLSEDSHYQDYLKAVRFRFFPGLI